MTQFSSNTNARLQDLVSLRDVITEKMNDDDKQMKRFINNFKNDIFRKIDKSVDIFHASQIELKKDVFQKIRNSENNIKSLVSKTKKEILEKVKCHDLDVKGYLENGVNHYDDGGFFSYAPYSNVSLANNADADLSENIVNPLLDDLIENSVIEGDGEGTAEGSSSAKRLVRFKTNTLEENLVHFIALSKFVSYQLNRFVSLKNSLNNPVNEEKISEGVVENSTINGEIENETPLVENYAEIKRVEIGNRLIEYVGGARKKNNDVNGKEIVRTTEELFVEDTQESDAIVKSLAKILQMEYDQENVKVLISGNSFVIKFQTNEEFEKWKKAARENMKKSKFSYTELLELEEVNIISNKESFDCPVCFTECAPDDGIVLRDCLHTFCRPCLIKTVEFTAEEEIKCPFADDNYVCDSIIQHREIKEIVPNELYEQYLEKTVHIAGNRIPNSMHCRTPDCRNFYIIDENDRVIQFECEVCGATNCVPCKAIHVGQDCREYQNELEILSETDPAARETLRMFDKLLNNKEAMKCPTCSVIVTKIDGCDWMQCSMCRTEICWATLGPRWGPAGHGDTSGGCRCKVTGASCHPKCNNCH